MRQVVVDDVSALSLERFLARTVVKPVALATHGWPGYAGPAAGYRHERHVLSPGTGDAASQLPASHLVLALAKRWLLGTHHGAVSNKHLAAYLDKFRLPLQTPRRQELEPPLCPGDRAIFNW